MKKRKLCIWPGTFSAVLIPRDLYCLVGFGIGLSYRFMGNYFYEKGVRFIKYKNTEGKERYNHKFSG